MSTSTAFRALADDTRGRIVELLARGERTAGEIAAEFTVSRPAVSRHLRVLREAGLVTWRGDAQRRVYRLDVRVVDEAADWLDGIRRRWSGRLDALEHYLDGSSSDEQGGTP